MTQEKMSHAQWAIANDQFPTFKPGRRLFIYGDGSAIARLINKPGTKDTREVWYLALDKEDLRGDAWEGKSK